ncbi:DUF1700 domain-containing protein [Clostridium sp. MCC353]|uniref:DUF1700 domain-containing protein n=1 Tax=Clostridium sp. MCC353 TaxID=2592646 RepID=UPI001C02BC3E|nr:DUF1700 domain-containing protein [Clostridium sp. MCC353]MBT9777118.1 DUF1700 domain-containing protein [Clostridium sp. MCC353]
MNREEFLRGLRQALEGNVSPSVIQENLRYYDNYISEEIRKGAREADVIAEIGDPRLIAKTIEDTSEDGADPVRGVYEEADARGPGYEQEPFGGRSTIHYYDLNKWYWKLLFGAGVVLILFLVIAVITGIFTLIVPLLVPFIFICCIIYFIKSITRR